MATGVPLSLMYASAEGHGVSSYSDGSRGYILTSLLSVLVRVAPLMSR